MTASPHVMSLGWETDQYDLRTRVKVRGPLTTLKNAWTEVWRTDKFHLPVGLWYDATDTANLRVLDRGTKRLYKLRQSDRKILSSVYLGAVLTHPLGLSGDPASSTVYWALQAPWRTTGVDTGNQILKLRKSDNHVLARWAIPDGRWSAIKVSSSFIWLTNLDTDKVHKRSKTDGSAISSYAITYSGVAQTNPSGLMIDGTTLYYFFSNSGTTARFLIASEGSPATISGVVKTAGTNLHGGEMDTTTHVDCYGDSDSLGLVAKFTLKTPVTNDVAQEAIDTDLEDELGTLAQIGDRVHDSHPLDAAHPFQIRRETMDIPEVTSLAQAMQVAQERLAVLAKRRTVLDIGIVGNPALQKGDLVSVDDPLIGVTMSGRIDTLETDMSADQPYVGVAAVIPQDVTVDDEETVDDPGVDDGGIDENPTPDETDPPSDSDFLSRPSHAVYNIDGDASVLIEDVSINGGTRDAPAGIGITITNVSGAIVIRNVDLANLVGGIYLYNCSGPLEITGVRSENIGDGTIGSGHSNHIQLAECVLADGSIHANAFRGGRTEDMISIYRSGGTSGHPLVVEDNRLQGLVTTDAGARAWSGGSGTGIIIGDGSGSPKNGYTTVRNNSILTPGQVGIQMIDGPGIVVSGNTIYGEQRVDNNNPLTSFSGNPTADVHDNRYWWTNDNGSHPTPSFGAGTITQSSPNVQDATIDHAAMEIVL